MADKLIKQAFYTMRRVVITPLLLQNIHQSRIGVAFSNFDINFASIYRIYINLLSLIHTHLQTFTEDTPIFNHNWSGDCCSWMCVSRTSKVHHYTVNVLPTNIVSLKTCCLGKTLLAYSSFICNHITPLCA